jgi:hypothetical protein
MHLADFHYYTESECTCLYGQYILIIGQDVLWRGEGRKRGNRRDKFKTESRLVQKTKNHANHLIRFLL